MFFFYFCKTEWSEIAGRIDYLCINFLNVCEMTPYIIRFESPVLKYGDVTISSTSGHGITGGVTVVTGSNGSGKTTLGTILEKGRYAYGNRLLFSREGMKVKMLKFTDIHSFTGVDVLRFDQRLESSENEFVPTVAEVMGGKVDDPEWKSLCAGLNLHDISTKKINYLSSGELRKLLIINALLMKPDMLVLDNPYIGLDAPSRGELDTALRTLRDGGTAIVLLLCDNAEIPVFADSVICLKDCCVVSQTSDKDEIDKLRNETVGAGDADIRFPEAPSEIPPHDVSFSISGGVLRYGDRTILSGFDWTVSHGDRWMLTGPNGSGKSLLLSIVCGDNPQAYSNRVCIFDRRRGSGETIWDIKDNVGYVCPEMQLYFRSPLPVEGIVVEGSRPGMKRYGKPTDEELTMARRWLELLGISHLASRAFRDLSSGEQRLVLLARAFVRQPALLVLDEPFQGLDARHKESLRRVIDALLDRRGSTLIFVTHYPDELPSSVDKVKRIGCVEK